MHYTCLGDDCHTSGFTQLPPTFSRDFFGYLCPDCTEMILRPQSTGIFCVHCKHVLILESDANTHRPAATDAQDHLLYSDACPICNPNYQFIEVRSTLLPDSISPDDATKPPATNE